MMGERYKSITKETQGVLRGEYGATPAAVNQRLQKKVLGGDAAISCRPADLLEPELEKLASELHVLASAEGVVLAKDEIDDVLTYALRLGHLGRIIIIMCHKVFSSFLSLVIFMKPPFQS